MERIQFMMVKFLNLLIVCVETTYGEGNNEKIYINVNYVKCLAFSSETAY